MKASVSGPRRGAAPRCHGMGGWTTAPDQAFPEGWLRKVPTVRPVVLYQNLPGRGRSMLEGPTDAAEPFRRPGRHCSPPSGCAEVLLHDEDESDDSMQNLTGRRPPQRSTLPFPQRAPQAGRRGFSRPRLAPGERPVPRAQANPPPQTSAPSLGWLLLELHALALDSERARTYLARPGCNILLGQAQLSRTLVKRSRILRFLREGQSAVDPFRAAAGAARRWTTRGGRA
jgi:hypothetical protein